MTSVADLTQAIASRRSSTEVVLNERLMRAAEYLIAHGETNLSVVFQRGPHRHHCRLTGRGTGHYDQNAGLECLTNGVWNVVSFCDVYLPFELAARLERLAAEMDEWAREKALRQRKRNEGHNSYTGQFNSSRRG